MDDTIRLARAYLSRVAEPPAPALTTLIELVGPIRAAAMVRHGDVNTAVAAETDARRDHHHAATDLSYASKVGARLVCPEDAEWPADHLAALTLAQAEGLAWAAPPIALWVRGDRPLAESLGAAAGIVGARAATAYGDHVASDFAYSLAKAGTTVVSGAAFGIDAAAHRGALAGEGLTVAVLPCGIDVTYPAAHDSLLRHIAAKGLLVTEYPPGTHPAKFRFLVRNRLAAAFSAATVVVEAGVRGGSRHTAAVARVLDRPVLAVPGPVTSATSRGCHDLLREHRADLVTSADEILQVLKDQPRPAGQIAGRAGGDAVCVFLALTPHREMSAAELATACDLPQPRVRAALADLELTRSVTRGDTGWRRV
ncbi:DNA-processing protein DprA [Actinokineospora sp. UTMC 2448]|uniref:DNA-processing protein DprA n=1 Tax=Actinokineospora sp. UTMC 2448 TaxID=2268449 RepID=UPI0021640847|nr:DNA-processing protein DprA [Actinokineospora sp. UTMC 2448]UVS80590.1 DNA protecting protein DprA [Actinokineospora sp. UTMC 2448]